MLLAALVLRPMPQEVADRIVEYAIELGVDEAMIGIARRFADGALGLAAADFEGNEYTAAWSADDVASLHTSDALPSPWDVAVHDPALAARWRDLGDGSRSAPAWPPPDAAPRTLPLVPSVWEAVGVLVAEPPASTCVSTYRHDPARPVPSRGGSGMILPPGPVDQDELTGGAHPGVVSFDGPPLPAAIELAGPVTASITFTSSTVDADVIVKLLDVAPDGRAVVLTDGICRARGRHGGAAYVARARSLRAHRGLVRSYRVPHRGRPPPPSRRHLIRLPTGTRTPAREAPREPTDPQTG
jgi:hypothetical protein